jgi:hypothetical protein
MEPTQGGDIVTVASGGPPVDGIVFDTPSRSKVVVAVMDPKRGPVFRTVHPNALSERSDAGAHDRALHLLVRKTPLPARGAARGGRQGGQGPAGYTRSTAHRPTGR